MCWPLLGAILSLGVGWLLSSLTYLIQSMPILKFRVVVFQSVVELL